MPQTVPYLDRIWFQVSLCVRVRASACARAPVRAPALRRNVRNKITLVI